MTETILQKIYRFPIKGFPGHQLGKTILTAGEGIPYDRRYALTKYSEDTGEWMQSRNFFINAFDDGLMKFGVELDDAAKHLKIRNGDGDIISVDLTDPTSLTEANLAVKNFAADLELRHDRPDPQLLERTPDIGNWDFPNTPISIINSETVKSISSKLNFDLDPLRFRGNLIFSNMPAWEELDLMGRRIQIGQAILEITRPIMRCPTPGVNPQTGERDIEFQKQMPQQIGHAYCGMYAIVVRTGEIKPDDKITILGDAKIPLSTALEHGGIYEKWPRMAEVTSCDIGKNKTSIKLKTTSPWQAPQAKPGQRLKLHLGEHGWTQEYITSASSNEYTIEVEESKTNDPVTEYLKQGFAVGEKIIISGPYGRV